MYSQSEKMFYFLTVVVTLHSLYKQILKNRITNHEDYQLFGPWSKDLSHNP